MTSRTSRIDTGAGASFIASAVIHLAVFLLLAWWGERTPPRVDMTETIYVDMVTMSAPAPLPVAAPAQPVAAQPPPSPSAPMKVPVQKKAPLQAKPPVKAVVKSAVKSTVGIISRPLAKIIAQPQAPSESAETAEEFNDRLARLQGKAEAQQYEERLKKLSNRKKTVAGTGKVTAPQVAGSGDVGRYVKTRLDEALKVTISYKSKKPFVKLSVVISGDGKLSQVKIIETSGDVTFGLAVMRAVDLANETFVAPAGSVGSRFEVLFHPEDIKK